VKFFYHIVLVIACAIIGFVGCSKENVLTTPNSIDTVTPGTISGHVTDAKTGTPIAGAIVTTTPPTQSLSTDTEGKYALASLAPGTYTVRAAKFGYTSSSATVAVAAGKSVIADIALQTGPPNDPPSAPFNPDPADAMELMVSSATLRWQCTDPEGDSLLFDIYLDRNNPPTTLIASGHSKNFVESVALTPGNWYWRVIAIDSHGNSSEGPVWRFLVKEPPAGSHAALEFNGPNRYDGTGQSIRVPGSSQLHLSGGSFSIEAWIKGKDFSSGRWHWIVSKAKSNSNADYVLGVVDGKVLFQSRNTANVVSGTTVLNTAEWYHVAAVQDESTGKLFIYLNGVIDGVGTLSGSAVSTTSNLFIAARDNAGNDSPCELFLGVIHDVRLWNRARSESEIAQQMKKRLSGTESGLVGYWRLDDGAGSTVNDATPNHNSGSLLNNPTWIVTVTPIP
jgi:hypothetical protein